MIITEEGAFCATQGLKVELFWCCDQAFTRDKKSRHELHREARYLATFQRHRRAQLVARIYM